MLSVIALWTLRSVLPAALLGAWLAAITEPLSVRVARRIGGRTRAAAALTLAVVLVLIAAAAVVVIPIVSDVTAVVRAARRALLAAPLGDAGFAARLNDALHTSGAAVPDAHAVSWFAVAREVAPFAEAAVTTAALAAFQLFVFVVTAYYLAIDGRRLQAGIEQVSPFGRDATRAFIREFVAVGRGIVLSMGVAALVTAAVLGVAFVAVGVTRPVLLAALAFLAAMMPVGAHIVWVPVACLLAWQGRIEAACGLTIVGIVGVGGFIDHALRPWLVRFGRLTLHPLLTVLGLFGGVAAFGAWGVFLGPLALAMAATAMRLYAARPLMARRSVVPGERVTAVTPLPPAPIVPRSAN